MAKSQKNLILSSLSVADFGLIEPFLVRTDMPFRTVLEESGERVKSVYFPEDGFASVVADKGKFPIEIGLIGHEGMTGLGVVLGASRSRNNVHMQATGYGQFLPAKALQAAMERSSTLHWALLRFVNSFLNQAMRTAVANGRCKINQRLARWILMAADRWRGEDIPLTQELLSIMLGINRPGITRALQELESRGMIARRRGRILIADRAAFEEFCEGAYLKTDRC